MKYPQKIIKNKKKYELVEIHKHHALYESENGIRECFKAHDLGLVKEYSKPYDISNHYTYFMKG